MHFVKLIIIWWGLIRRFVKLKLAIGKELFNEEYLVGIKDNGSICSKIRD